VVARGLMPDLPIVHLVIGGFSCIVVWVFGLLLSKFFDKWHKETGAEVVVEKQV